MMKGLVAAEVKEEDGLERTPSALENGRCGVGELAVRNKIAL